MLARAVHLIRPAFFVASLGLTVLVGAGDLSAQVMTNPFIPDEQIGVIDEQTTKWTTDGREAQTKLNTTLSCALYSVWTWIGKPLLIVMIFGTFFYELFKAIRGNTESASRMLWSLLAMMLFLPVNAEGRARTLFGGTIIDKMMTASGIITCPVSNSGWKSLIESGNPPNDTSTPPSPLGPITSPAPTIPTAPIGPLGPITPTP